MITQQYEKIIAELEAGERKSVMREVFEILSKHPEGVTRRQLVELVYWRPAHENINNDPGDRKIRDAISRMREHLIPIISTSGASGYCLDDSEKARNEMLTELVARRNSLNEQIKAASMAWKIPVQYQEPEIVVQGRLM